MEFDIYTKNAILRTQKLFMWSDSYASNVLFEFHRFMAIRATNDKCSPSNDIDKLWHEFILITKDYYDYCMKRFQTYVHHNTLDAVDQPARKLRLNTTIEEYKKTYGPITYPKVWGIKTPIYLFVLFTFNNPSYLTPNLQQYNGRKAVLECYDDDTFQDLKQMINTQIDKINDDECRNSHHKCKLQYLYLNNKTEIPPRSLSDHADKTFTAILSYPISSFDDQILYQGNDAYDVFSPYSSIRPQYSSVQPFYKPGRKAVPKSSLGYYAGC